MESVSSDALVRRACLEDRTNCSTIGAVSGWVNKRHPPAMLRRTRPEPRSSSSRARRSQSPSTVRRSTSSACASTEAAIGSSETKNSASRARVSPPAPAWIVFGSSWGSGIPLHLDLSERRPLLKLDLPFTVQLEDGQEPPDHVDPVGAIRHQVTERRRAAEPLHPLADGHHRVLDRVTDRRDVREVE